MNMVFVIDELFDELPGDCIMRVHGTKVSSGATCITALFEENIKEETTVMCYTLLETLTTCLCLSTTVPKIDV